jgi:hypothetical protein
VTYFCFINDLLIIEAVIGGLMYTKLIFLTAKLVLLWFFFPFTLGTGECLTPFSFVIPKVISQNYYFCFVFLLLHIVVIMAMNGSLIITHWRKRKEYSYIDFYWLCFFKIKINPFPHFSFPFLLVFYLFFSFNQNLTISWYNDTHWLTTPNSTLALLASQCSLTTTRPCVNRAWF